VVPKPWGDAVLVVPERAAWGVAVRIVKVLAFVQHSPSVVRRTQPSDPKTVRVAASRRLVAHELPKTEALATPSPPRNRPSVPRVSAQRISHRLVPASPAHRGAGPVVLVVLAPAGEALAAPVDLVDKAEGPVAPADLVRLMVAAVPGVAGLRNDRKPKRSQNQRIDS